VSDLAAVAAVLRAIAELTEPPGVLSRLHLDIEDQQRRRTEDGLRDAEIRTSVFAGASGTAGAGADVIVLARLPDGRRVSWAVEVGIDAGEPGGPWRAVVKGDVDRDLTDEPSSDEECLFLEQRTVHDVAGIQLAVRQMARLVVGQDVI